jgi:predicted metal-binding protein
MEGLGPNYGDPVYLGVIMASTDTLALDTVATEAMGMDPAHVDYLCLAAQSGLGCADMHSIDIVGVPLEEIRRPFKQVSLSEGDYDQYGIKVIRQGACSGCNHFIETVVTSLIDKGRIEKLANTTIVYGQNAVPPEPKEGEDLILLGSCMRKYKNRGRYMPGCPPHPHDFEHRILS